MSDWADKVAMAMFRVQEDDVGPMDVAELLREVRIAALEEACLCIDGFVRDFGQPWRSQLQKELRALKDET